MLIPTKHERLQSNIIVVGAYIVKQLKGKKKCIEDLYVEYCNKIGDIGLDTYLDAITMLYIIGKVEVNNYCVRVKQ